MDWNLRSVEEPMTKRQTKCDCESFGRSRYFLCLAFRNGERFDVFAIGPKPRDQRPMARDNDLLVQVPLESFGRCEFREADVSRLGFALEAQTIDGPDHAAASCAASG